MNRRDFVLRSSFLLPSLRLYAMGAPLSSPRSEAFVRVRPNDPRWPSSDRWAQLREQVEGRLLQVGSPFNPCASDCRAAQANLSNPYYLGDTPGLTETSGWVDAWSSQPSVFAVKAAKAQDVAATLRFAHDHRLRLVVKGGGHSYQGNSEAPDSLMLWTRAMNQVQLESAFVCTGAPEQSVPQPAVHVGAGAMWADVYHQVTTLGGRYVQGGGCMTVGVPGLVQGGGFNSFSKRYGSAAGNLLEAEIVTADGKVRTVNKYRHRDLFWALQGGGGGSFGVVTRMTLRTHELPEYFGAVLGQIEGADDEAFRELVAYFLRFYKDSLWNPHWGERFSVRNNVLQLTLLFQDLDENQVRALWTPFFDWVRAHPKLHFREKERVLLIPARHFWDYDYLRIHLPDVKMIADMRPSAPPYHTAFADDEGEIGWFIHGYDSAWLPASLLTEGVRLLVESLFAASRHWSVQIFVSKGLAGGTAEQVQATAGTSMHPSVGTAFALAICAGGGKPAFAGLPGGAPDLVKAREDATKIRAAMAELRKQVPHSGAYFPESDYFEQNWQEAFWGTNYAALARIKKKYDPSGLFFVRHGVGSELWSEDGFTLLQS